MYSPKIVAKNRALLEARYGHPLREYSFSEVEEFENRLRGQPWETEEQSTIISALPPDLQEYITSSMQLSQIDFRYWANRYCNIQTVEKRIEPFRNFWPGQEKLLQMLAEMEETQLTRDGRAKMKVIILKARQLGQTAIAEAIIAHMTFLQMRTQSIVGSDDPDNTRTILYVPIIRMYDYLPGWMKPVRDAKVKATNLHFPVLDSDIVYVSGNQKTTMGQGMTIDAAHLTEVSTWLPDCVDGIDSDLIPAFESSKKHHSLLILESTGQGAKGNWFHDQYQAAARGESSFKPLFLAWFMRPDWSRSAEGVEFGKETKAMAERVRRETGVELTKDQLAWWQQMRQDALSKDKLDVFQQEFPSTPEESFQTGFRSVFPITLRTELRDKVKRPFKIFEWDPIKKTFLKVDTDKWLLSDEASKYENHLIIWEKLPDKWAIFVVGVDASYGIDGGDNSAIEVLRVGDSKVKDRQAAEWCGNLNPVELADVAWKIGHLFNSQGDPALMAIEANPGSPGRVTQSELLRRGYPNFYCPRNPIDSKSRVATQVGWQTTASTRPLLTERGVNAIKEGWLEINSISFIQEMSTYVNTADPIKGRKHLEHAPGYHDDRIMALFIAFEVAHGDDLTSVADQRRREKERQSLHSGPIPKQLRDLDPMSWEEAVKKWEDKMHQYDWGF